MEQDNSTLLYQVAAIFIIGLIIIGFAYMVYSDLVPGVQEEVVEIPVEQPKPEVIIQQESKEDKKAACASEANKTYYARLADNCFPLGQTNCQTEWATVYFYEDQREANLNFCESL